MGGPERLVFDFDTNAWVPQGFLSETQELLDSHLPAPAIPPSPGRWTRPAKPILAKRQAALALSGAAAFVVAGIALREVAWVFPAAFFGNLGLVYTDSSTYDLRVVTQADRHLLEDPEDPNVCLVALNVVRNGKSVGRDKGVVWFDDGLLLYNGHRTSFAIGGEDVLPRDQWELLPNALSDLCVPLRVPSGIAHVELAPLVEGNGGSPSEMRFLKRLYAFRLRPPLSRGPRQWPPLES